MPKSTQERAARALCELAGNPPGATMDGKPLWMSYLPEVRTVLRAIREPSEDVLPKNGDRGKGLLIWYGMIDRALGE